MLFNILALTSLLTITLLLRKLVNIFPSAMACLIRWKESLNIDASVKLQRDRNYIALALIIPFCLSCYRFGLYSPSFISRAGEDSGILLTIAIFVIYILLRMLTVRFTRPVKMNPKVFHAASTCSHTFFIMLALVNLTTGGILSFLDLDHDIIKNTMIWLSAGIYIIFLIRKMQIFQSSCSIFAAFLYLCALEILPTGVLIASAVIF